MGCNLNDVMVYSSIYDLFVSNCSVSLQLQAKIHAESLLAMGFLLGRGTLSYGQRSECADLLNSYIYEFNVDPDMV
ncbi:hypothetical protein K040078D81_09400 [Blautia hominis]|uniref:Uncharacterized protein n=1 Tax=Blautia hominis TaxID=2025493 RepID=A0ABQ0B609_9FIRM